VDIHQRRGTPYLRVHGKGGRIRNIVAHPVVVERIHEHLEMAGHGDEKKKPLFRPVRNNRTGRVDKALHPNSMDRILLAPPRDEHRGSDDDGRIDFRRELKEEVNHVKHSSSRARRSPHDY
jgi:hypothetical protein